MQYHNDQGELITEYLPDERSGGLIWGLLKMIKDVHVSRYLIWNLFLRDFNVQFRQQLIGYFWAVLGPLMGIASFVFMAYTGILNPGDSGMPYPLYVFIGTSLWGYMIQSMTAVGGGLQAQADLIMRTNIPKIALAVSTLGNVLYSMLINYISILLIMLLAGYKPSWMIILYPILAIPILMVGTGIGLFLAVTAIMAKDLTKIATQALTIVMYATPVVYVVSRIQQPIIKKMIILNPLTYLIDVPRSLGCLGTSGFVSQYVLASLGAGAFLLVSIRAFYLLQDLVAERL